MVNIRDLKKEMYKISICSYVEPTNYLKERIVEYPEDIPLILEVLEEHFPQYLNKFKILLAYQ